MISRDKDTSQCVLLHNKEAKGNNCVVYLKCLEEKNWKEFSAQRNDK